MNPVHNDGRKKVNIVIALILSVSIFVIGTNMITQTGGALTVQLIRFCLTLLLCYLLYLGAKAARAIVLILFIPSGIFLLLEGLIYMADHPSYVISVIVGLIYCVCFSLLLFPKSVRQFFRETEVSIFGHD